MSHRLFILISNTLRGPRRLSLSEDQTEVLLLPQNRLTVEKEPPLDQFGNPIHLDPWDAELKLLVVERIKFNQNWKNSRVRVAGHLKPCFGSVARSGWREDQRFPEKEKGLKDELCHEIDVQIWGFHREAEWSHIWSVARGIKSWISDDTRKIEFLNALDEAFRRAQQLFDDASRSNNKREMWEALSLAKHEIVALFDPLRIRLETAREISQEDPQRAGEIRASVKQSIDLKLATAQKLLSECQASVVGEEAIEWFRKANELLNVEFDLIQFPEWLNQLDADLHNLRNSVTNE